MITANKIKAGALLSYFVIIFNIIAGLLYTPWMIHQIGKADFGLYILVTSFLAYFVVDYGIWMSINKLLSQYRAKGDQIKIQQTIGIATKIYLCIDIIILFIISFIYLYIDVLFSSLAEAELLKFKTIFIIAGGAAVINFPFTFIRGIMYSHEYLFESRLFELSSKIILITATVLALSLSGGLYSLVLVYAFVPLLRNISMLIFLYRKGIRMQFFCWSKSIASSIFNTSAWLLLIVLAELFINNISPIIIAMRASIEEVAVFAIGLTIYGYVYQISNAISGMFLPQVAKLQEQNKKKEIKDWAIKVGRIQLLISGYIIFAIFTTGATFIEAWVGKDFSDSYIVASLLIIPGLITYSQQIEGIKLLTDNKIGYKSIMMICTAISSVILSYIFTSSYGAIGAATAICISNFIFMNVGMNIIYVKILEFKLSSFLKFYIPAIVAMILIAASSSFISSYINVTYFNKSSIWVDFLISAFIYTLVFIVISWFTIMNAYEKKLIRTAIQTVIKRNP